jgi:hypothetical protein
MIPRSSPNQPSGTRQFGEFRDAARNCHSSTGHDRREAVTDGRE